MHPSGPGPFVSSYLGTVSAVPRGRPAPGMEPRPVLDKPTAQPLISSLSEDYRNYRNISYDPRTPQGNGIKITPEKTKNDVENEDDREKKKEKKWTLGGFFRRRNKKELEESSDEEDAKKGFLHRKRSSRSKRKSRTNGFDVVVPLQKTNDVIGKTAEELWSGPNEPQQRYIFRHSDVRIESNLSRNSSGGSGSLDSRKGRREMMARAQAKRDQMRDGSSSDENGSGQSSSSVTREGRRRRPGRPKIPSATPSPSRSPRVQPKMPLHGSSSYPLPVHTYPPGYHWEAAHSPNRRTLLEYEQFLSACGSRNRSMSYDQDMHRAEAMFVQLPIARTRSSCIQAEAHGEVPNLKPDPPPRMRPVGVRVDSTSSLPIQPHPMIQRSSSGNYFGNMYENLQDPYQGRVGSYQHIYQNCRAPNGATKATVQYSQSAPKPVYYQNSHPPNLPVSPQTDLRYYADQNPRSRNPIHITCSANPSPTSDPPCLSDSQVSRRSTKEFWRQKDQELQKRKQAEHTSKTDRSRSNSPALSGVVNSPKSRQTAVVVSRKIIHGVSNNYEPAKVSPQPLTNGKAEDPMRTKTPPNPPVRRHSKIEFPVVAPKVEFSEKSTNNLDDALNELETIYKSLRLSEDYGTPVKSKAAPAKSPDKIADDMAVRRLAVKECIENKKLVQQSYLQCSPVLGATPRHSPIPPPTAPAKSASPSEPDITLDDVVFRNHRHANSFLKTPDPQPPFGIPIGPVTPAANSDYLHVNPVEKLRNSFLTSKFPDIVKDDLAFRNLRKDNLTANLPPTSQPSGGAPKKRAVRSLSENLFNLMQKDESAFLPIEANNNVIDKDFDKTQSMTDLHENLQRDSLLLEKRLKALKEEKQAKRAEFFEEKLKTPVPSWSELRHSSSVDSARQRSTSTETLIEDVEVRLIREGIQKKVVDGRLHPPPAAPERRHFRSPVVELSKYPAAVPATALYQNPFKEEPVPLDESQLDDLLSKIAREAKITSEAIGRQLVELEVAAASDMLSPERKQSGSKLDLIEVELKKDVLGRKSSTPTEKRSTPTEIKTPEPSKVQDKKEKQDTNMIIKKSREIQSPKKEPVKHSPFKSEPKNGIPRTPELTNKVEVIQVEVCPPPVTHKVSFTSNLTQILLDVEKEHTALCKAFPEERKEEKTFIIKRNEGCLLESPFKRGSPEVLKIKEESPVKTKEFTESVVTMKKEENILPVNRKNDSSPTGEKKAEECAVSDISRKKSDSPVVAKKTEETDRIMSQILYEKVTKAPLTKQPSSHELEVHEKQQTLAVSTEEVERLHIVENVPVVKDEVAVISPSTSRKPSLEEKPTFEPISDLSEIMDSEDVDEFLVPASKVDVFEEVYEYNCPLLNLRPPQQPAADDTEPIAVNDEVKRILATRGRDSSDEADAARRHRGESSSRPRGVTPGGPDSDAEMNRRSSEVTSSGGSDADRARERIERYKDRRRQELNDKFPMRGTDSARATCQERNKTEPTVNKTESSAGEARRGRDSAERELGGKVVRETKASRLRAATHSARTEPEKTVSTSTVPGSSRRESADKSHLRKSFLNRSHTSEPTKEDPLLGITTSRRKSGSQSSSPSVSGHVTPVGTAMRDTSRPGSNDERRPAKSVAAFSLTKSEDKQGSEAGPSRSASISGTATAIKETSDQERKLSKSTGRIHCEVGQNAASSLKNMTVLLEKPLSVCSDSDRRTSKPTIRALLPKSQNGHGEGGSLERAKSNTSAIKNTQNTVKKPLSDYSNGTRNILSNDLKNSKSVQPSGQSAQIYANNKIQNGNNIVPVHNHDTAKTLIGPSAIKNSVGFRPTNGHHSDGDAGKSYNCYSPLCQTPSPKFSAANGNVVGCISPRSLPVTSGKAPPSLDSWESPLRSKKPSISSAAFVPEAAPAAAPEILPAKPSILKKKSVDEPPSATTSPRPVSILKRKTLSQDGAVTFSPSVVDRVQNRKRQGILKKRRSLDENEVSRQRSSSPDKSILKNQRRSSLEELTSILKRDSTETLQEPQGILKRKSATPPLQEQHVTIADSVIMAAAAALGEVQPCVESVRPILKKKSSSEEHTPELSVIEPPRPILKKKSVEVEDVPLVRPILKTSRKSSEEELPSASILKWATDDAGAGHRVRRARSVSGHERARSAPPARPLSFAEPGTDFENFLQSELQTSPPPSPSVNDDSVSLGTEELEEASGQQPEPYQQQQVMADVDENWPQQLAMESAPTQDTQPEAEAKPKEVKNSGVNRFRERKLRDANRFRTQPISADVIEASTAQRTTSEPGEDGEEDALSKLSLSERVKLFNARIQEAGAGSGTPCAAPRRPRSARFKTQPVTDEEITLVRSRPPGAVSVLPPLPAASALKSILKRGPGSGSESSDSEVKSILAPKPRRELPNGVPPLKIKLPTGRETANSLLRSDEGPNLAKILQGVTQEAERTSSCLVKSQSHSAVSSVISKGGKFSSAGEEPSEPLLRRHDNEDEETGRGLRRSTTQPLKPQDGDDEDMSGLSIKERLAKLRQSGEIGWQKRKTKLKTADEVSVITTGNYLFNGGGDLDSPSILASRLGQLDTAREGWKSRVPESDAKQFTVEGRMGLSSTPTTPSTGERTKRSPKQARFRSRNFVAELHSTPSSPAVAPYLTRSLSAPGGDSPPGTPPPEGPTVAVPTPCDETFEAFFQSLVPQPASERLEINLEDLDVVQRSDSGLLVQKRIVQVQRRRHASRNPVKSLAMRSDLQTEYMEIKTGIAERELRRLKIEKLSRGTNLAVEALAGLASTEDFTAVNLRKPVASPVQYPDTMLLRIKGRRHVETRLVEPLPSSVNTGDCYLLVTRNMASLYMGELSNVVERARAKEVAARVEAGELACAAGRISSPGRFWEALGGCDVTDAADAGPPDEDERIEAALMATNMVYELSGHELVPINAAWGAVPKVELLQPHKNLVFDFGTEMYVWSGKSAPLSGRREAAALARELWGVGFDYTDCEWSPLGPLQGDRPPWALFCKITQNMEPVLFREKFQDWPDEALAARHTGVTEPDGSSLMEVHPCDAETMRRDHPPWPDLELEGTHLGRGESYLDEETRRVSQVSDVQVSVWRVSEFDHCELTDPRDFGQFREDGSYVVRWHYSVAVTVRGLNGAPSRHTAPGRDRFAYFLWHGKRSPAGDRGAAAVLTVSLDSESAPQIVIPQLAEPPAFLRLFGGGMAVHRGSEGPVRMYLVRGSAPQEAVLLEVDPAMRSLRSKACFVIVNQTVPTITLWCGCQASDTAKQMARTAAERVHTVRPSEFCLPETEDVAFNEEAEGSESEMTLSILKGSRNDYHSLLQCTTLAADSACPTPRLFHFASTSGEFAVQEVASPLLHPEGSSPYLFLQSDLYAASQPALFLLDVGTALWLWHGWPEAETAPSALVRHQAERRAAMRTAIRYWELTRTSQTLRGHLVWAGLEPAEFISLFPFWEPRDDVAELNIKETNRGSGDVVDLETELNRLSNMRYPLAVLLQRPLPDGVDPTLLEDYLMPDAFPELFEMTRQEFMELPSWKKNTLKKEMGLF